MTADWRDVRLEDVADELTVGYVGPMASEYVDEGIPFLRSQNVEPLRINRKDLKFISPEFHQRILKSRLRPGDVVIVRTGKPGACAVVPYWLAEANCSDLVIVRCGNQLNSHFLAYYVNTVAFTHVAAHLVGAVQQHFNVGSARELRIHLPGIDEQHAIAGVLGALDDKIEQNRRTERALERLARATFRAWFVDFAPVKAKAAGATAYPSTPQPVFDSLPTHFVDSDIGSVPRGWAVEALSSVCSLVSGGTPKRSEPTFWGGDVPWYSVKDAPGDGEVFVVSTSERITQDGVANSAATVVPKGSTIISARGTVGKLAMAGLSMAFNQSCYGLLPRDGSSFCYLNLLLQTAVAKLQQHTHGSVFDTITRSTFDGLLVASPRGEDVTAFETIVSPLFELLLASRRESLKLAAMRDYLLPKLLTGQVCVGAARG